MNRPNALVFDLDGTLLDTLASLASAFNRALEQMGHPANPVANYRNIIGDGARNAACRALPPASQSENEIKHCLTLFREAYHQSWQTATIYEGINELLGSLPPEIPLAVLSNKDDFFTQKCVTHFFPDRFHLIVGASATINHKPDPSGALYIAKQLQTKVDQLWMIGDTGTDMKAASRSGMTGIGVLWGFRDRNELANHGASHIIEAPNNLLHLLEH